jgi:acyl carrier protein
MQTLELDDIRRIVETALDKSVPVFQFDSDFYQDLGLDSIGAVSMIVEIQRHYHVRIPESEVQNLRTPRSLIDYISAQPQLEKTQ